MIDCFGSHGAAVLLKLYVVKKLSFIEISKIRPARAEPFPKIEQAVSIGTE
jgi:hypothetical protein